MEQCELDKSEVCHKIPGMVDCMMLAECHCHTIYLYACCYDVYRLPMLQTELPCATGECYAAAILARGTVHGKDIIRRLVIMSGWWRWWWGSSHWLTDPLAPHTDSLTPPNHILYRLRIRDWKPNKLQGTMCCEPIPFQWEAVGQQASQLMTLQLGILATGQHCCYQYVSYGMAKALGYLLCLAPSTSFLLTCRSMRYNKQLTTQAQHRVYPIESIGISNPGYILYTIFLYRPPY